MELGTPQDWAQGAGALKSGVEALRGVVQLIKELASGNKPPTEQERKAIDLALEEAEKAAKLADAQTAKALGYTLCHCQFPPVAMLTVGYLNGRKDQFGPVHECPSCGRNTAAPYSFARTVPPREQSK
jgi:hypothetical protein